MRFGRPYTTTGSTATMLPATKYWRADTHMEKSLIKILTATHFSFGGANPPPAGRPSPTCRGLKHITGTVFLMLDIFSFFFSLLLFLLCHFTFYPQFYV